MRPRPWRRTNVIREWLTTLGVPLFCWLEVLPDRAQWRASRLITAMSPWVSLLRSRPCHSTSLPAATFLRVMFLRARRGSTRTGEYQSGPRRPACRGRRCPHYQPVPGRIGHSLFCVAPSVPSALLHLLPKFNRRAFWSVQTAAVLVLAGLSPKRHRYRELTMPVEFHPEICTGTAEQVPVPAKTSW